MLAFSPARTRRAGLLVSVCGLAAALAGCASLPSSGPTARQLLRQEQGQAAAMNIKVVDITPETVPAGDGGIDLSGAALVSLARGGRVDLIGPGDSLEVGIFEVGTTLFGSGGGRTLNNTGEQSSAAAFDPSARRQNLTGLVVDQAGNIRVPYVGILHVAGRTTDQVEALVERGLRGKSQMPQAVVSVRSNISNTVLVSGGVARPGRQPLTLGRERLLDAIATAGGVPGSDGYQSALVRFTRDGRTAEAFLPTIASGSAADLVLVPGDRIDVIPQTRSFTVFGAAPRVSQIRFDTLQLSLNEAIARAGGPDDNRADPTAVFVFRSDADEPGQPRIYRLDLTKPSSFFLGQRFQMRDKDVLYVANARVNQARKLVEIINLLFSPFFNARAIAG
jgi:polysaccharide export outer membrane protein